MSQQTDIRVEWWPIENVVPYDANPRIRTEKQIEELAKSITEFGWKSYINVDPDGVIITGHGRRLAAIHLGLKTVPVVVERELAPEKIRAFRIMDNKVAEGSGWDHDLLKIEMAELLELLPDQIDLTGFSLDNVTEILGFGGADDDAPPGEFKRVDPDEPTQHKCPKCGYEWNGKAA